MAKLYFKYGAMGSSKSAQALITKFNYEEKGMSVWLIKPSVDTRDPYGDPVRPHIVFFGEAVPNMEDAAQLAHDADIFVVIGTSLVVYPAAALIQYVKRGVPIYYIDPNPASVPDWVHVIKKPATQGVADLINILRNNA